MFGSASPTRQGMRCVRMIGRAHIRKKKPQRVPGLMGLYFVIIAQEQL